MRKNLMRENPTLIPSDQTLNLMVRILGRNEVERKEVLRRKQNQRRYLCVRISASLIVNRCHNQSRHVYSIS